MIFHSGGFVIVNLPSLTISMRHCNALSCQNSCFYSLFCSGPVLAMVWEGLNAVKTGRVMLGATNPADSAPGTIRGDLCIQVNMTMIRILPVLMTQIIYANLIDSKEFGDIQLALSDIYLISFATLIRSKVESF